MSKETFRDGVVAIAFLGFAVGSIAQTPTLSNRSSLSVGGSTRIDYGSVAEARQALEADEANHVSRKYGWTIIQDRKAGAVWSFTPENHPAHPTMVKRTFRYQSMLGGHGPRMGGAAMADLPALQGLMQMSRQVN